MKKTTKRVLLLAALLSLFSSVYAGSLNEASAGTVEDDTTYVGDLLRWSRLDFDKLMVSSNFNATNSLDLRGALNFDDEHQLSLIYLGNTWEKEPTNDFNVMFGFNKLAIKAALSENFIKDYEAYYVTPGVGFGINFSEKVGVMGNLNIGILSSPEKENSSTYNKVDPNINAYCLITFKDDETMYMTLKAGGDIAASIMEKKTKANSYPLTITRSGYSLTVSALYNLQYAFTENFRYGLNAQYVIFSSAYEQKEELVTPSQTYLKKEGGSTANSSLTLDNGFISDITEKLQIAAGYKISFPIEYSSGTKIDNTKAQTPASSVSTTSSTYVSKLQNTFYAGFALYPVENLHIDFNTNAIIADGVSFDECWKQNWTVSATAKF